MADLKRRNKQKYQVSSNISTKCPFKLQLLTITANFSFLAQGFKNLPKFGRFFMKKMIALQVNLRLLIRGVEKIKGVKISPP